MFVVNTVIFLITMAVRQNGAFPRRACCTLIWRLLRRLLFYDLVLLPHLALFIDVFCTISLCNVEVVQCKVRVLFTHFYFIGMQPIKKNK